jgi:hypothetical protein
MNSHDDPVDAVILAFLDYLEGVAPRPTLDHLSDDERARASAYLDGMEVARGLDPTASRPSTEALLIGTPLSPLVAAIDADGAEADLATVATVLAGVDPRVRVTLDESADPNVLLRYLDLRARFVLVPGTAPVLTETVRTLVARLFSDDPDTSRVGVIAAHSGELTTQLLAADEIGATITTPRGEPHLGWDRPLPLRLAARAMLEQSAPEWPAFDFDSARIEALDVTNLAAEIARRIIARESGRSYQGDKRRAYQALVGKESLFADLVARVTEPGHALNLDDETTRIARVAA